MQIKGSRAVKAVTATGTGVQMLHTGTCSVRRLIVRCRIGGNEHSAALRPECNSGTCRAWASCPGTRGWQAPRQCSAARKRKSMHVCASPRLRLRPRCGHRSTYAPIFLLEPLGLAPHPPCSSATFSFEGSSMFSATTRVIQSWYLMPKPGAAGAEGCNSSTQGWSTWGFAGRRGGGFQHVGGMSSSPASMCMAGCFARWAWESASCGGVLHHLNPASKPLLHSQTPPSPGPSPPWPLPPLAPPPVPHLSSITTNPSLVWVRCCQT